MPSGKPQTIRQCRFCGQDYCPNGAKAYFCGQGCRFMDGLDIGPSCWNWNKSCLKTGYGSCNREKTHHLAHEYYNGPRNKFHVLHSCDNPKCCNPDHLRLGTHQDNMKDRKERKRGKNGNLKGEKHPSVKLTHEQVLRIRKQAEKGQTRTDASKEFGVGITQISRIISHRRWAHL